MPSHITNKRYRDSGGKKWIEVRVPSTETLFDHRDPSPFRAKDLDDDFVEYIYSSARELPIKTPLKIVIYIDEEDPHAGVTSETIREAIQSHLSYLIDLRSRNMKSYWKRAQFFLVVGLLSLFGCLGLAQNIPTSETPSMAEILREGIIIF